MITEIKKTELIKDSPQNTGLLSKTNSKGSYNKFGLNPLFTILNNDFNKQLIKDFDKQMKTKKQIINRDYLETNQKDIIRLYKEYYPETFEETLTKQLIDHNNKPRLDFFHIGLDSLTRSLPISLDDITAYSKRGGYNNYVFSFEARPNIIVFDFDLRVTSEDIEKIKQDLRKYLYLLEYKESNGHLHVYINGTSEKRLDYTNSPDRNNTLFTRAEDVIAIDVFKGAKKVIGCCSPNNDYEIVYNEKPPKSIELKQAIQLLAKSLGYTVNTKFLEDLLYPEKVKVTTSTGGTKKGNSNPKSTPLERVTRETTEENKKTVIEHATPLFNKLENKGIRETMYRALTGALLNHEYEEEIIEEIVTNIHKQTNDKDNRLNSVRSCFRGYYQGSNLFGWTKFNELVTGATNNKELIRHLALLKKVIYSHDKQAVYNPENEKDYIILDNGLIMDTEDHIIFTYNSKNDTKTIKMSADITGVTVYTERHVNPLIESNLKLYSVEYTTVTGAKGHTTPEDIDVLTGLLNKETFTRDDKKTKEILKNIIEYFIIQEKATYKQITPPEGFYLDVETNNIAYIGLTKEITEYIEKDLTSDDIKEVLQEYETLSTFYKDPEKYIANTLSGCQLPLTYLNKQISEEYSIQTPDIRAVSMTGTSGAGKSYNCEFILKFSSIPIENKNIKLYSSINTIYRYAEQCIKSTLPLMIDEADGISYPKTTYDIDLSRDIKASITSMYVREKSNDQGKTLTSYHNYRNIVINSNAQFQPDYGNRRRLTSQVYTLTEKITPEDVERKNLGYPDNKERVTLNKFFGIFINLLIQKIKTLNNEENKHTAICDVFSNKDFTKNIILDMYYKANLDTKISNMIYNYNTDMFNADINPVDTLEIIRYNLYNYILSAVNESLKPNNPKDHDNIQTTLDNVNKELYNVDNLKEILFNAITKGNIKGVTTAVNKMPDRMEHLEIALTQDIVTILNNNKDIQITLKDLVEPTGGQYKVVKKIGARAIRLTLNDLITNVFY